MKKLLFALMAVGLMASASSCKCGYCKYPNSQGNTDAVCQGGGLGPIDGDGYKQAKANCSADGGVWVITK